jgi:hypothetical protein
MLYPSLLPADIGGVKSKGPMGYLAQKLTVPYSGLFHHFIVGDYIAEDDDYVILESINKGVTVGRLSFYDPSEVVILRRVLPFQEQNMVIRRRASVALTELGRCGYDWLLAAHLILAIPQLLLKGKKPPYRPEQFPYGRNSSYVCTEAVAYAWSKAMFPIIPKRVVPLPAAIVRSYMDGHLELIYEGTPGLLLRKD